MKTQIFSAILLFCLAINLSAQESTKSSVHQIGLSFSSLNSFGVTYKTGSEKCRFRVSALNLGISNRNSYGRDIDSVDNKMYSYGIGLRLGFEKQSTLYENLSFLWGLELEGGYRWINQKTTGTNEYKYTNWQISTGIYVILGVEYNVAQHWIFGAEITPGVWYNTGKTTRVIKGNTDLEETNHEYGFGFNTASAALSVGYRF